MQIDITDQELSKIRALCPGLQLVQRNGRPWMIGCLEFSSRYDEARKELRINVPEPTSADVNYISDNYLIEIEIDSLANPRPNIKEVGKRIDVLMAIKGTKNRNDLHINDNGTICFCVTPEKQDIFPDKIDLYEFLTRLIIPYFYALSFFEKYDKWPWGQRGHADLGILEYYLEQRGETFNKGLAERCLGFLSKKGIMFINRSEQIKGCRNCFCGKAVKFRNCHNDAFRGLYLLQKDYREHFHNRSS